MRANQNSRLTTAGAAFVEDNQFRMKVVGKRNDKKKQNQSAGKRSPFAQRIASAFGTVVQPARPPEAKGYDGNRHPQ
jgi:hypothetical protein